MTPPDGHFLARAWALAASWGAHETAWRWALAQWPTPAAQEQDAGASLSVVHDEAARGLYLLGALLASLHRELASSVLDECERRLHRLHALMIEGERLAKDFQRWRAEQAPRLAGVPVTIRLPLLETGTVRVITDP